LALQAAQRLEGGEEEEEWPNERKEGRNRYMREDGTTKTNLGKKRGWDKIEGICMWA
jgi:hypothetical protein